MRVRNPLPGNDELDLIASNLVERYMKTIEEEYGELIKQKNLMKSAMNVALVRVDDLHLVAQIDLPTWDVTVGDESLIGTWMVLRELDELWQVDDMEGIPRRFWLVFK